MTTINEQVKPTDAEILENIIKTLMEPKKEDTPSQLSGSKKNEMRLFRLLNQSYPERLWKSTTHLNGKFNEKYKMTELDLWQ